MALAYLWTYSGAGDRAPFDELWKSMRERKSFWNFSAADRALLSIYQAVGAERSDDVPMEMWKRWHEHEAGPGPAGRETLDSNLEQ